MGAAVGLVLETRRRGRSFSALDLRGRGLAVARAGARCRSRPVPRLRRHWRVRGYAAVAAGLVLGGRRRRVLLHRVPGRRVPRPQPDPAAVRAHPAVPRPVLPALAGRRGQARTSRPDLPQVAGEPLYYHWFAYAHMAMTEPGRPHRPAGGGAAAGHPGAVRAGRSCSPRSSAGGSAAARTSARSPRRCSSRSGSSTSPTRSRMPFGTQATFVIWHGMSMIYGWVLLIAVIAPLADDRRRSAIR